VVPSELPPALDPVTPIVGRELEVRAARTSLVSHAHTREDPTGRLLVPAAVPAPCPVRLTRFSGMVG
jgi:hypothetical protein